MIGKEELARVENQLETHLRKVLSDVERSGGFTEHMQLDAMLDCIRGIEKCHKLKDSTTR